MWLFMSKRPNGGHDQASQKKVKSGCKTCKFRKVKCDEGFPICRQCQVSGRICQGYGVWGGGDNDRMTKAECSSLSTQASVAKPMQVMTLTSSEGGCFEWYMYRSAVKLPGAFISAYWTTLLVQACATEPAIRHAVLALASAHMEEVRGVSSRVSDSNDEQALFTVRQYSKAIVSLQPCFSDNRRTSLRITLITCALFVQMEFLRGHYTKGIAHLDHGLSLIQNSRSDIESQDPSSMLIDGWILTFFTRLLVQVKLFGQDIKSPAQAFLPSNFDQNVTVFRSVHHARRTLEHIMLRIFNVQEQAHHLITGTRAELGTVLLDFQIQIQRELQLWLAIHQVTIAKLSPRDSPWIIFIYDLLRLYHRMANVLADTCLESSSEMIFDRHDSDFLGIISQCIETYNILHPNGKRHPGVRHDPELSSPNSISDIGWIAPLYFTAMKCRNYRTRHQAVQLLQLVPHKEGIWNAYLVAHVARQVIELEEGRFYDYLAVEEFNMLAIPTDAELSAAPTLPEEFRLNKIKIVLPENRAGKLLLSGFRKQSGGMVEWIIKEYDLPSEQWKDIAPPMRNRFACNSLPRRRTIPVPSTLYQENF